MQHDRDIHMLLQSEAFVQLRREKRRLIVPSLLFIIVFYFSLPLSVWLFPAQMMQASPVMGLPWGWLYAFSQFVMTFCVGWLYWRRSKRFDRLVEQIKGSQG
ncbi:DUF485 domain-containing protein [Salicibibacter cibarius]|nr:DUF485 domain-containing protein [Salicibibacter cibarius]